MSKTEILVQSLRAFFDDPHHASKALVILEQPNSSLRIIDFFVTMYARDERVIFKHHDILVDVYASYRNQLKSFRKKYFDIFRRGERTSFDLNGRDVDTTLAQLNFVKWLIKFGIDTYFNTHRQKVLDAMAVKKGRQSADKKRATSCVPIAVRVSFD